MWSRAFCSVEYLMELFVCIDQNWKKNKNRMWKNVRLTNVSKNHFVFVSLYLFENIRPHLIQEEESNWGVLFQYIICLLSFDTRNRNCLWLRESFVVVVFFFFGFGILETSEWMDDDACYSKFNFDARNNIF